MSRGLDYIINLEDGNFSGATNAKKQIQGLDSAVERNIGTFNGLKKTIATVGIALAASFAGMGIMSLANDVMLVRGQFQGFENLLSNQLGPAGEQVFADIKKFAAQTPFEVDQITQSFIKLQGAGFNPTMEKMAQLGDFTASKMKTIDQFTEAIIDAQTGEFERLKEFGIRASKSGENVTFTYNGVAKTMRFSQAATENYLLSLSKLPGIAGSMDSMAQTFIGRQSNVNDQMAQFKDRLGKDLEPVFNAYLDLQSKGIELLQDFVDNMKVGIEYLSQAKSWLIENSAAFEALGIGIAVATAGYLIANPMILANAGAWVLNTAAMGYANIIMGITTAAQWALNAAMTANPIGIIVVAIGALAAGLYYAYQKSETFRAAINGIVEVGKLVMDVFTGVGKVILGAFTFNSDMFMDGVKQSIEVAKKIADGGIADAFNKGFDESKAASKKAAIEEANQSAMDKINPVAKKNKAVTGPGITGSGKSDSGTSVSSSRQVRNVTVTINKLVESLTVSTTNLQGTGSADIKRIITEVLTGAVHDSELALSSS